MLLKSTVPPPLLLPAPRMVCASSINKIQRPLISNALSTFLTFSSKSPRYLLPANKWLTSKLYTVWSLRYSGTWLLTMLRAKPSASMVLPTPGSPTNSILALLRLAKTCAISCSSESLPIIGSILPLRAISFRLVQYSARTSSAFLGVCTVVVVSSDSKASFLYKLTMVCLSSPYLVIKYSA